MPDIRKDDMSARRTSVTELRTAMPFNQYLPNRSNQSGYVPAPLRRKKTDKEEGTRKSWSTATSPVGGDRPFRSVSMIDMRGEDESMLQPHSQVRHELMHNQYNKLKEEEDHWQDDLARWKNRRRSVSQDLIKKEEERKTMENLLTGEPCTSQRRRSIKTYREIVEDKERREEDLRNAYRRARTPEEASFVLQRYAQRFSISEAILERLQLPQLLDRSVSADPSFAGSPFPLSLSASPTTPDPFDEDPDGPLRFLRQQSAPAPKFTATLEARIEEFPKDSSSHHRPQIRSRSSEPPSTRALSPKPVPLLTPKPYFELRGRAAEPWANKELQKPEESFWKTGGQTAAAPEENNSNAAAQPTLLPSDAKQQEVEKAEPSGRDISGLVSSTQQSPPVTSQVKLPTELLYTLCEFHQLPGVFTHKRECTKRSCIGIIWISPDTGNHTRAGPIDNNTSHSPSQPPAACPPSPDSLPPAPNRLRRVSLSVRRRSVSGRKLCSSCGQPLGKGAAMIIETLSLYFHIHCFKCGVCKGQLGDTTTGTDVRIRNGLLNCHQCYIRSRSDI
ncbi:hypothetical protein F2P81_008246 [Scophthalmus maximus]|uniref:LIM zinc-binding domain-containing protein n=1 Tax=Scophthalmus maximus TaxID=52904 RepID=A0A6A4TAP2_SCOMX|nr:hypothetical protein F2P81_008246 [Scophthalmus maximus]